MQLSKEDQEFINDLSREMKSQDNRGTADPLGIILLEEVERFLPVDYGGEHCIVDEDGDTYYNEDLQRFKEYVRDCYEDYDNDIYDDIMTADSIDDLQKTDLDVVSCHFVAIQKEHEVKPMSTNFFLTTKAYNEHIKINRHNLTKPQSYGISCGRNEELSRLYDIIHKLAESDVSVSKKKPCGTPECPLPGHLDCKGCDYFEKSKKQSEEV